MLSTAIEVLSVQSTMSGPDQTLVRALFAQGFSPAKIRQRFPLLNSAGDPRFTMGEIEAVVKPIKPRSHKTTRRETMASDAAAAYPAVNY